MSDALREVREDLAVRIDQRLAALLLPTEPPLQGERIGEPGGVRCGAERRVRCRIGRVVRVVPVHHRTVERTRRHHRLVCRRFRQPELAKFGRDGHREVLDEEAQVRADLDELLPVCEEHGAEHERFQLAVRRAHVGRVREELPLLLAHGVVCAVGVRVVLEHVHVVHEHVARFRERAMAAQRRPPLLEFGDLCSDGVRVASDVERQTVSGHERIGDVLGELLFAGGCGGEGGGEEENEHEWPWVAQRK